MLGVALLFVIFFITCFGLAVLFFVLPFLLSYSIKAFKAVDKLSKDDDNKKEVDKELSKNEDNK